MISEASKEEFKTEIVGTVSRALQFPVKGTAGWLLWEEVRISLKDGVEAVVNENYIDRVSERLDAAKKERERITYIIQIMVIAIIFMLFGYPVPFQVPSTYILASVKTGAVLEISYYILALSLSRSSVLGKRITVLTKIIESYVIQRHGIKKKDLALVQYGIGDVGYFLPKNSSNFFILDKKSNYVNFIEKLNSFVLVFAVLFSISVLIVSIFAILLNPSFGILTYIISVGISIYLLSHATSFFMFSADRKYFRKN